MATSQDDIKDRLERIARGLRQLHFPVLTFPEEDAQWLAAALQAFVDGEAASLDDAIGAKRSRGGQPDDHRNQLIADEWVRQGENATYAQVADALAQRFPRLFPKVMEPKQVKRAILQADGQPTQYAVQAFANRLAARLSDRAKPTE
jgi:hypothetical protein